MTNMFIPKREKIKIVLEAIVYILLILITSYFTIYGNIFARMIPMIYFLGIFGIILFNRPIITGLLTFTSMMIFGFCAEQELNTGVVLFSIYSVFMIACGAITGHILNLFYENYKLRKFIKYYHKIMYMVVLIVAIIVPILLNNLVNGNFLTYNRAKNDVNKYINENYIYSSCYIDNIKYIRSNKGGLYEFYIMIDDIEVKINYTHYDEILDINMAKRIESLNKIANAEINILLKENDLTNLDVECIYNYSKIATTPDMINLVVKEIPKTEISDVIYFFECLKGWNKYGQLHRIDVLVNGANVSITKQDLESKEINEEYILNGMEYEALSSREGM